MGGLAMTRNELYDFVVNKCKSDKSWVDVILKNKDLMKEFDEYAKEGYYPVYGVSAICIYSDY
jgi:hypothetical protein